MCGFAATRGEHLDRREKHVLLRVVEAVLKDN